MWMEWYFIVIQQANSTKKQIFDVLMNEDGHQSINWSFLRTKHSITAWLHPFLSKPFVTNLLNNLMLLSLLILEDFYVITFSMCCSVQTNFQLQLFALFKLQQNSFIVCACSTIWSSSSRDSNQIHESCYRCNCLSSFSKPLILVCNYL